MASNTNICVFTGNLTRDAELRMLAGGQYVLQFSVAVNSRAQGSDGWEDRASFFDCSMYGNRAQSLEKYMVKGQRVAVVSSARQSRWEKDGQKRSKVEFVVKDVELLGRPEGSGDQRKDGALYDVDIPF